MVNSFSREFIDVSMTIVVYRTYNLVLELIDSIEKYTDQQINKKIFIVDNGSKVSTGREQFVMSLKKYKDIEYIDPKENLGYGKAHNFVMNKLDSKYHIILNPDILFKEDSISKLIAFMEKDETIGMCIPRLMENPTKMQLAYRIYPTIQDMFFRRFMRHIFGPEISESTLQFMDYTKPFQVPFGQGSFLFVRTSLFRKMGGFDERFFMYLEDTDLCRRVNENSRLMYCPYTEVFHDWDQGSRKKPKLFMIHTISMIRYFKKWGISWY